VTLERVLAVAELTTRHDRKYVVSRAALSRLLPHLPAGLAVLDIDGVRVFAYETTYFDTPDFALYRHHVQGRRKRYKTRTRTYFDTRESMFEVKLKGVRDETVKMRVPYDFGHREELTYEGRAFLERVIAEAYEIKVPSLVPTLRTGYNRATLVDLERRARLTIDVDLTWSNDRTHRRADHLALIETKSLSGPGPVDALLRSLGVRPERMSKYCLGVALLDPETPANRWSRLLRRQFEWERTPEARAAGA
jgi:hypothetical protein